MSIFGIYALICTFLLMAYYMVTFWFDLHGTKGSKKEETETIATGDMVDTETSTDVRELAGGGYQLTSGEYDDDSYEEQPLETPSAEPGDGSSESSIEEVKDTTSQDKNDDNSSDGPSDFERVMKAHDESCAPVQKQYEMQLMGVELMAKMTTPIHQKNELHRRKLYC